MSLLIYILAQWKQNAFGVTRFLYEAIPVREDVLILQVRKPLRPLKLEEKIRPIVQS